jgi:hypothetical protein
MAEQERHPRRTTLASLGRAAVDDPAVNRVNTTVTSITKAANTHAGREDVIAAASATVVSSHRFAGTRPGVPGAEWASHSQS